MASLAAGASTSTHMHAPLVQPIIFCGPGSNLYPLCSTENGVSSDDLAEQAASTVSSELPKAMLPILNRPMLAYPLQHLLSSGLRHAIIFAPSDQHQQISAALKSLILIPPTLLQPGRKTSSTAAAAAAAAAVEEASRYPNVSVSVGLNTASSQSNPQPSTNSYLSGNDFSVSSVQNETVMRVELLPLGPDDIGSKRDSDVTTSTRKYKRLGTAGLIDWLHSIGRLDKDPLIVPVDLISQSVSLSTVIDSHIAGVPQPPALTCLMFERGAGEGTGKEREKDGPPKMFTAYDRIASPSATKSTEGDAKSNAATCVSLHRLLLLQDSDDISDYDSSDLHLRMSLLWSHPHVRLSTSLLDSHIYLFNLPKLLGLLRSKGGQKMKSLREQVVPFMAKCSWMAGLREKAGWNQETSESAVSGARWTGHISEAESIGLHMSTTFVNPSVLEAGTSLSQIATDSMARTSSVLTPDQSQLITTGARDPRLPGNIPTDLLHPYKETVSTSNSDFRARAKPAAAADVCVNALVVRLSAERKHPVDPSLSAEGIREREELDGREEHFFARANTVPTYMECNRHLLRSLAAGANAGPSTGSSISLLSSGSLPHPLPNQSLPAHVQAAAGLTASALVSTSSFSDQATSPASNDVGSSGLPNGRAVPGQLIDAKAQISTDSLIGEFTRIGERSTVKRSVVGRGCLLGKNVKITSCIVMDRVKVGDNAKLENCILCPGSVVEEKSNLKDCDVAAGVKVSSGTNSKNEKFDE